MNRRTALVRLSIAIAASLVVAGCASDALERDATPAAHENGASLAAPATHRQASLHTTKERVVPITKHHASRPGAFRTSPPHAQPTHAAATPKAQPKPKPTPTPTPKPKPVRHTQPAQNCTPGYSPCVPIASDVDCAGGSGNGPAYVDGPIRVTGDDPYDLDADGDGYGCEDD
jgi:hypothetical protein